MRVKVAIYSFDGPTGQIAVVHRLLVEEKHWVRENRFLHALNLSAVAGPLGAAAGHLHRMTSAQGQSHERYTSQNI